MSKKDMVMKTAKRAFRKHRLRKQNYQICINVILMNHTDVSVNCPGNQIVNQLSNYHYGKHE